MKKQQDQIILIDSPEAAHYQTGIKGWVSAKGHYFGDSAGGERIARYDGCTHVPCQQCGKPVEKGWTTCDGCLNLAEIARYEAMPRTEWDGKAMLYSQALDRWYNSPDDAAEDLGEVDGIDELADMLLVICRPVYARQLESDYFADDMAEDMAADQELPGAILDAMDAFNAAVAGIIVSWEPGKTALAIAGHGAMTTADNDLAEIWEVLAPMFVCITYDADGWWTHVKKPQHEWSGFDKPALSRQLSGLLRMPLCGSERVYERPTRKSAQGMTTANDLPARLRKHADRYVAADPIAPVNMRLAKDMREAAAALERAGIRSGSPHASHENGAERLCRILYGRGAEIGDTIGGLDAQMLHDAAAEIERTGWRDIATAPRDGRGFQAWLTSAGSPGWWEPRCHFGLHDRLGIWRRIDGSYGFDYSMTHIKATHWMPPPSEPTPRAAWWEKAVLPEDNQRR